MKYEFTGATKTITVTEAFDKASRRVTLHRIRAIRDIPFHNIKVGDEGGWLESEKNLSQNDDAWVDASDISGESYVYGRAYVLNSNINGNSNIQGDAVVLNSVVSHSILKGNTIVDFSNVLRCTISNSTSILFCNIKHVGIHGSPVDGEKGISISHSNVEFPDSSAYFEILNTEKEKLIIERTNLYFKKPMNSKIRGNGLISNVSAVDVKSLILHNTVYLEFIQLVNSHLIVKDSRFGRICGVSKEECVELKNGHFYFQNPMVEGRICFSGDLLAKSLKASDFSMIINESDYTISIDTVTLAEYASLKKVIQHASVRTIGLYHVEHLSLSGDDVYLV